MKPSSLLPPSSSEGAAAQPPMPPSMTDLHALFNPEIRPPLDITRRADHRKASASSSSSSSSSTSNATKKLFDTLARKNKRESISNPTDFRHVVHVGNETIASNDLQDVVLKRGTAGFGMHLKTEEDRTVITKIAPDGPAALTSQLAVGDEIAAIDGEKIHGLKHDEVIQRLKGKEQVKLSVRSKTAKNANNAGASSKMDGGVCRVCGKAAQFNCSVCGPSVLYCSPACQKLDWGKHKADCKMPQKGGTTANITPTTGACRVCRTKNARYRCACGGPMYCSEKCQHLDWPSHRAHCGREEDREAPDFRNKTSLEGTFFVAAERYISRMSFYNGVFEYIWTVDLMPETVAEQPKSKSLIYPTFCYDEKRQCIYAVGGGFVSSLSVDHGQVHWRTSLGFPLHNKPLTLLVWNNIVIVAGSGTIIGLEKESGKRLWKKLLKPDFLPVSTTVWENFLFAYCGGTVYAMILTDNNVVLGWRTDVPGAASECRGALFILEEISGGVCEGETVLYAVCAGAYALRISDGTILYQQGSRDRVPVDCASLKNEIMFIIKSGKLSRVDPVDLKKIWSVRLPEVESADVTLLQNEFCIPASETSTSQLLDYDIVYVGMSYRVIAVDAATGDVLWMAKLAKEEGQNNEIVTLMKIGDDVIAATAGRVYALSANSGNPLRKAQLPQKEKMGRFIALASTQDSSLSVSCPANMSSIFRRE